MVAHVTRQVKVSAGGVCGLGYHVVCCPKYRRPVLAGRVAARCQEAIHAKASGRGWRAGGLEIMPGHVRLSVKAHPSHSPSRVASQFKGFNSRWLRADLLSGRRLLNSWRPDCRWMTAVRGCRAPVGGV